MNNFWIWEDIFNLAWNYTELKENESKSYLELLECLVQVYDHAYKRKISVSRILNDTHLTLCGNFAHGVCLKVFNMILYNKTNEAYGYIHLLFYLKMNRLVNMNIRDSRDLTPLELCKKCATNYPTTASHNRLVIGTLIRVLDDSFDHIIVIQAHIRRWLAVRRVKRTQFHNSIQLLLYSPPYMIENNHFKCFPGGILYWCAYDDFEYHRCTNNHISH